MGTAAVFIDGGYVDKVLYYDHNRQRVDYEKLVRRMVKPDDLLRAYYYHCMPYQSNPPSEDESRRYGAMHKFVTAIQGLPRFEVRLGRLSRFIHGDGTPVFTQKRVDCMVGVDMALLAGKGKVTRVILFSGDSDYIPAVEAVKREGVIVTLWHGITANSAPSRELVQTCDERCQLTAPLFQEVRRS